MRSRLLMVTRTDMSTTRSSPRAPGCAAEAGPIIPTHSDAARTGRQRRTQRDGSSHTAAHWPTQILKIPRQTMHAVNHQGVALTDISQRRLKLRTARILATDLIDEDPIQRHAIQLRLWNLRKVTSQVHHAIPMPPRCRGGLQRHIGTRLLRVAVIEEAATGTRPGASFGYPQRSEELGGKKPDFSPSIIRLQPFVRPLANIRSL